MHLFVIQSTQKSVLKSIYDTFISDKNNISSYKIFKFNEITNFEGISLRCFYICLLYINNIHVYPKRL